MLLLDGPSLPRTIHLLFYRITCFQSFIICILDFIKSFQFFQTCTVYLMFKPEYTLYLINLLLCNNNTWITLSAWFNNTECDNNSENCNKENNIPQLFWLHCIYLCKKCTFNYTYNSRYNTIHIVEKQDGYYFMTVQITLSPNLWGLTKINSFSPW